MFNIKDYLEIIIPTYNRKKDLENALKQFLSPDSPVRSCLITILDNASNDDTETFVTQLISTHPNIQYKRHKINIGMGANICTAMALASKPYYWLVGDDDSYDFTHWNLVEKYRQQDPDCLIVTNFIVKDYSAPALINHLGLLSAGIYKTANITPEIIQNAYANIVNMFPHFALITHLINEHKKFIVMPNAITIWGTNNPDPQGKAYIRGCNNESKICPRLKYMWLSPAWYNILQMLKDSKLKSKLINEGYKYSDPPTDTTSRKCIKEFCKTNSLLFNNYYANIVDAFFAFNIKNKLWLLFYVMYFYIRKIFHKEK